MKNKKKPRVIVWLGNLMGVVLWVGSICLWGPAVINNDGGQSFDLGIVIGGGMIAILGLVCFWVAFEDWGPE